MNQIPMGAPQGGMPNIVKPIADGIDNMFKGAQDRRRDMSYLAANHALTSVRNERQHGYNKDLQGMKQRHESGMQRRDLAVRQSMQTEKLTIGSRDAAAQRRHEMRTLRTGHSQGMERLGAEQNHELNTSALSSANTVAELRAKTRAVNSIGKRGRVSEFKVGDIQAKFNPFTEAAPAQNQSPAPSAPEAPQATAASTAPSQTAGAFIPKVVQGPGGKIMKNPDHPDNKGMAPAPVSKKAAAKRATAKKSAPRPRKK
jgi:hypothetical protein